MPVDLIKAYGINANKATSPKNIQQIQKPQENESPGFLQDGYNYFYDRNSGKQGLLQGISNSDFVNNVLGAGDALASTMSAGTVNPVSGSGGAYNLGKVAGNIGGFVGGGELLDTARAASEGLPYVGKLAKSLGSQNFLPSAVRRATGSAAYGALTNPDDRSLGAEKGAGLSALTELPILGIKGIGNFAEAVNPKNFAKDLGDNIYMDAKNYKGLASSLYKQVTDKFGNYKINKDNPYASYQDLIDPKYVKRYYNETLKDLHNDFMENPSLDNAHRLQSQIGNKIAEYKQGNVDSATDKNISGLEKAQDYLKDDIKSFLQRRNPQMADTYQQATDVYRSGVAPFKQNDFIARVANGKVNDIQPSQLSKALNSLIEKSPATDASRRGISPLHPLMKYRDQLAEKINRSNAITQAGSILGGAALGGLSGSALGGDYASPASLGGLGFGALGGKLLGPSAVKLAQNPEVIKFFQRMNNPYNSLIRTPLLANQIPGGGQ